MILLVAPSNQALPGVPVSHGYRRLVLGSRRDRAETRLRQALGTARYRMVISAGFAAAADRRLQTADLLLANRVFGSPDVYLDLPPYQAPGVVHGGLYTLAQSEGSALNGQRLPVVHAFDDHGFWLARAAESCGVPCLLLRAILAPAGQAAEGSRQAFASGARAVLGSLRLPSRPSAWRALPEVLRDVSACRARLASTLSVLLVLNERK